jgi:hypothetical protein
MSLNPGMTGEDGEDGGEVFAGVPGVQPEGCVAPVANITVTASDSSV